MKSKHVWLAGGLAAFIAANCLTAGIYSPLALLLSGFVWTLLGIFLKDEKS